MADTSGAGDDPSRPPDKRFSLGKCIFHYHIVKKKNRNSGPQTDGEHGERKKQSGSKFLACFKPSTVDDVITGEVGQRSTEDQVISGRLVERTHETSLPRGRLDENELSGRLGENGDAQYGTSSLQIESSSAASASTTVDQRSTQAWALQSSRCEVAGCSNLRGSCPQHEEE